MAFRTRAVKRGGGVRVPIPTAIAKKLRIVPGSEIEVQEHNGSVLVTPVQRRPMLADMLRDCKKRFPKGNPHGTVDFGPAVGKETW